MKIRTQLWLNTGSTVIIAIAVGVVLVVLDRESQRLRVQREAIEDVSQAILRLNNLTLGYLRRPGQRSLAQWRLTYGGLTGILNRIVPNDREESAILKNVKDDHGSIGPLFERLIADTDAPDWEPRSQILTGQLLIKTQAMLSLSTQLARIVNQRQRAARQLSSLVIAALTAGLAVVLAASGARLSHGIMAPLRQLTEGSERIGSGDLTYRIGSRAQDEVGELARSFDRMAENLSVAQAGQQEADRELHDAHHALEQLNRELEQRVQQRTAALEEANAELESFSYSVSHDLRTPLRAIDGFSRILLEDYEGTLDAEGKRLLNVVRDNTVKMAQLIDDILQFSRSGRHELTMAKVDMEQLAHEVAEELRPDMEDRKVHIGVQDLPDAYGDRTLLRQVLSNLLANAIKFTRRRPDATIEISGHEEGAEHVYTVKDNGVGFDMQYVDKLFGVFQRLHTAGEFEGTGIGLAIVKRMITRHGGRVWAESKPDEGATFHFTLPVKEASHA